MGLFACDIGVAGHPPRDLIVIRRDTIYGKCSPRKQDVTPTLPELFAPSLPKQGVGPKLSNIRRNAKSSLGV